MKTTWTGVLLVLPLVVRMFGLLLMASALMKMSYPYTAIESIMGLGIGRATADGIVGASVFVELFIGGALATLPNVRVVSACGAVTAFGLLCAHAAITVGTDSSNCGCFGAVSVVPWALYSCLALGGSASMVLARQRNRKWGRAWVLVGVVCGIGAAGAVVGKEVAWSTNDEGLLAGRLLSEGVLEGREESIVVVGSTTCRHCRELLSELMKRKNEWEQRYAKRLVFVVRRSDVVSDDLSVFESEGMTTVVVNDDVWWSVLEGAPPRILAMNEHRVREFVDLSDLLTSRPR